MIYDELLGKYIENGNEVIGVPEVDVEKGTSFGKEFEAERVVGADVILQQDQEKAIILERSITQFENQLKVLKEQRQVLTGRLLNEMQNNGLWQVKVGDVTISRKKAFERKTLDSTRLKADMPEIVKMYEKSTQVAETIQIKLKKEEKEGTEND